MNSPPAQSDDINLLEEKLRSASIPQDLYQKASSTIERLVKLVGVQGYSQEFDNVIRYIDWIINLPWFKRSPENLSLENAKKILDSNHFGLDNIKERILEYISILNLRIIQSPNATANLPSDSLSAEPRAQSVNPSLQMGLQTNAQREASSSQRGIKAPTLLLLGLVGTGKTTMAYSIAQALGRKFGRIPMGGMGDALQLRGRSRAYPNAEPGQIMKVLRRAQAKNPVILLDEIDRITDEAKADMMGVLVELLDPEQNSSFFDHFIDYPFDLSEVFFVTTANNTAGIATAVLDRLEVIEMSSYTDEQKITIGKNYLLPKIMAATGLGNQELIFAPDVWPLIVRPLGFDAGMRTLERTIDAICRKVAKLKVRGEITSLNVTKDNLKAFLPTY